MKIRGTKLTREQRNLLAPFGINGKEWWLMEVVHGKAVSGGGGRSRTDEYTIGNVNTGEVKTLPVYMDY